MSRTSNRMVAWGATATSMLGLATDGAAQASVTVDLAQLGNLHPGFRIDGIDRGDYSGWCVSGAGDVNGDGLADVVVGAPYADLGRDSSVGESYVIFGRTTTSPVDLNALGSGGVRLDGSDPGDRSGWSVSGAGDVNGDGLSDFIVGATLADPNSRYGAGESYVVFGRTVGFQVDLGGLGGGGFRIDGVRSGDFSGASVSGAGDVNGDGLADLVIGAAGADPGGVRYAGESYVVFGKTTNTSVDLSALGTSGFRIDGIDELDRSGGSVSGAGDVNGDGLADLVVGADGADPGGDFSAGESYVVFGRTANSPVDLSALGNGGFRIDGIDRGDRSGWSVAGAGDVNGDGLSDLIVGAPLAEPSGDSFAGESYVVFGRTANSPVDLSDLGTGGFRIEGINARYYSGRSASSAGDVNGDGLADLIVGAHRSNPNGVRYAGQSHVVFGKTTNTPVYLSALGEGGFRIDGIDQDDFSGWSVAGAGDVNGDSLADLIVGAWGANPGGYPNAGQSYVVFSPSIPPTSASYRTHARAGDAPRVAVGICGDGSDDDSPSSRCWIDFDGGQGPGNRNSSLQTVTLARNDEGIRILKPERLANVQWRVETNRTGWRKTRITLKYTDAEIAGLREETLRVWRASSPRGPWALYSAGMVREPQRNRISVNVPALGYFVIEGDPR